MPTAELAPGTILFANPPDWGNDEGADESDRAPAWRRGPLLVWIVGPPFSGKAELATTLARSVPEVDVLVSSDDLGGENAPDGRSREESSYLDMARVRLRNGRTVILSSRGGRRSDRSTVLETARRRGGRALLVEAEASPRTRVRLLERRCEPGAERIARVRRLMRSSGRSFEDITGEEIDAVPFLRVAAADSRVARAARVLGFWKDALGEPEPGSTRGGETTPSRRVPTR